MIDDKRRMTIAEITSVQNALVKSIVELHLRKNRDLRMEILVEGQHPVTEALAAGLTLKHLFVRERRWDEQVPTEKLVRVTEGVMFKLCTTDSPPPVLGVFEKPQPPDRSVDAALTLALFNIQDPGNLGTLLRSAVAFGVNHVLTLGEASVDLYHPKVIRASAGLGFRLGLSSIESVEEALARYASHQWVGADAHGGVSYGEFVWQSPSVLVMGSEAHGLPESLQSRLDMVHIPMMPEAESLNVAISGAILLADRFRRLP